MNHVQYINRYGFARWLLRECVRANPLYVISAALLGYGVTQLNTEIDPQIGHAGGIILSLSLLHLYEIAVLIAATVVLRRRTGGGRDLHGLTIVAGLFLGGTFLALDELIAIWPRLGFVLVPAALALAALKLAWYARLPGIYLPRLYRHVMLLIIGAHSISPLLGPPDVKLMIGVRAAQNVAWCCGWLSLIPVLYLIGRYSSDSIEPRTLHVQHEPDPLVTHRCGGIGVFLAIGTGMAHLHGSDWVFDRPSDPALWMSALVMLSGAVLLLRLSRRVDMNDWGAWDFVLAILPALLVQWIWFARSPYGNAWSLTAITEVAPQLCLACIALYLMLAWITRRKIFYAGLAAPLAAPAWTYLWRTRNSIPYYRALANILAGFCLLVAGVIVSVFREKLLAQIESREDAAN